MTVKTIPGIVYALSASEDCSVTATTENGTKIILCSVSAGGQKAFQAISGEVEVSDSDAVVVPFADAPVPLGLEGGCDAGQVVEIVTNATKKDVEETAVTSEGGTNYNARYLQIAGMHVPTGVVTKIGVKCRADANGEMSTKETYLAVWEKNEMGEGYTRSLTSVDAVQQVTGETKEWTFVGLELHGRTVRLVFLTEPEAMWPGADGGNWELMGCSVSARAEGDTESAYIGPAGGVNPYCPAVSFRHIVQVDRFAPAEHAADETVHVTEEEKQALHNIVENPPHDGAKGDKGERGVTFTPSVADDGTLSWSNDGELENPSSVNLKGEPGKDAELTEEQTEALTWLLTNKEALEQLVAVQAE